MSSLPQSQCGISWVCVLVCVRGRSWLRKFLIVFFLHHDLVAQMRGILSCVLTSYFASRRMTQTARRAFKTVAEFHVHEAWARLRQLSNGGGRGRSFLRT